MSSAHSRSSDIASGPRDPVGAVLDLVDTGTVILIDGRSGAGKSTFATDLVRRWPRALGAPQLVRLDSLYPGWDGLEAGAAYACARILVPHAAGRRATWQEWDWTADVYAVGHVIEPDRPLVVEGSGAITAETAPLAPVRIWLEADAEFRRRRALARDGDTYRPHWDRWAAQEDRHSAQHAPRERATHVFDVG